MIVIAKSLRETYSSEMNADDAAITVAKLRVRAPHVSLKVTLHNCGTPRNSDEGSAGSGRVVEQGLASVRNPQIDRNFPIVTNVQNCSSGSIGERYGE